MLQAFTNGHDNLAIDPAFVERDAGISDVREIVGCADAGMEAVQGEEGEEVVYDGGRRRARRPIGHGLAERPDRCRAHGRHGAEL